MLKVQSHEYDPEFEADLFVFEPGAMKALTKVMPDTNGELAVYLGIEGISFGDGTRRPPTWSPCANKEIAALAMEAYNERNNA